MKIIKQHVLALKVVFEQLSKGNFLWYFIPGLVITGIYYWLKWDDSATAGDTWLTKIPVVGGYLETGYDTTIQVAGNFFTQVYIFFILTILSPFNTFLSEKLDTKLTNQPFEGGIIRIINDFIRMIFVVILALFLELLTLGIWWIVSKIFGLSGTLYDIGTFLIAAFYFGFSFYDYSLERYNKGVFSSLGFAFSKLGSITLTGALFNLIYLLPVIGIAVSPVIAVMVATVVYIQIQGKYPVQKLNHEQ